MAVRFGLKALPEGALPRLFICCCGGGPERIVCPGRPLLNVGGTALARGLCWMPWTRPARPAGKALLDPGGGPFWMRLRHTWGFWRMWLCNDCSLKRTLRAHEWLLDRSATRRSVRPSWKRCEGLRGAGQTPWPGRQP